MILARLDQPKREGDDQKPQQAQGTQKERDRAKEKTGQEMGKPKKEKGKKREKNKRKN